MKKFLILAIAALGCVLLSPMVFAADAATIPDPQQVVMSALAAFLADPWGCLAKFIAIASIIAMGTPTPAAGSPLARLYAVVDFCACNFGHAKDPGASVAATPAAPAKAPSAAAGTAAALAVMILAGIGLSACAGTSASLADCAAGSPNAASCAQEEAAQVQTTSCNAYANIVLTLASMKAKLSAAEVAIVDQSIPVVQPLCHGPAPASGADALAAIDAELTKLRAVQLAHPQQ